MNTPCMPLRMRANVSYKRRVWIAIMLALAPAALAREPRVPLPAPVYSFDANSPSVISGLVSAADLLLPGPCQPNVAIEREALGLFSPLDDIDALSPGREPLNPSQTFVLLFSVDRQTVGSVPPDRDLVAAGVPFNAFDQALRGQAAGDQFMSLTLFTSSGPAPGQDRASISNNVLVRNNFDEGGTDFSAQPATSAQDNAAGARVAQDNVDAAAHFPGLQPGTPPPAVYFSLTAGSPSLLTLPGPPSGANIYFNAHPGSVPTTLYATFDALGLMPGDDIDALVVFDSNDIGLVGVYDAVDRVIFSLAPGSPSLVTLQGSPADLFVVTPGAAPQPFAAAELFGLSVADNMDSLDFIFSTDPFADALRHGIRSFPGDMNCDDRISFGDINPFVLALSGQDGYMAAFPFCNWYNADCNGDGQVNFADINPFVALLSGQ